MSSRPLSMRMNSGLASGGGDAVEGGDRVIGVDGVGDEVGEGFPGVLVGDVEDLDGPPGRGHVELVVECPHVVRMGG